MPGRTPTEAYFQFIDPIQRALNFITVGRFTVGRDVRGLRIDVIENAALNNGDFAPIRSSSLGPLLLTTGLRLRIDRIDIGNDPFDCQMIGYWFSIFTEESKEIIAFHWTPHVAGLERSFPHLHIGSIVSGGGSVLPERFHKLHIPTEIVSAEAFVRFAIEEFEVVVRPGLDRAAVLRSLSVRPIQSAR